MEHTKSSIGHIYHIYVTFFHAPGFPPDPSICDTNMSCMSLSYNLVVCKHYGPCMIIEKHSHQQPQESHNHLFLHSFFTILFNWHSPCEREAQRNGDAADRSILSDDDVDDHER